MVATTTGIAWTETTWNPVVGCSRVSAGCANCYAFDLHETRHRAFQAGKLQNIPQYARPFTDIQFLDHRLGDPTRWRKPRRVFVNSMSDLFHESVTDGQIRAVLDACAANHRHTFQVLTKRAERLACFDYPPNVWLGVTVESDRYLSRVDALRNVAGAVRWLSCEPLLSPLALDLDGIHWVVVGGESGPRARPMAPDWARDIRDQCAHAGVAFFMKQMAGKAPIPADLLVREYPAQVN
jgi:protein gp37